MTNVVQLRNSPVSERKTSHPADDLSFLKKRKPRGGGGIDYWNVKPSGDHYLDFARGKELALEYLSYIGQHPTIGNSNLLPMIVSSMLEKHVDGRLSGVAKGFIQGINDAAMITAIFAPHLLRS